MQYYCVYFIAQIVPALAKGNSFSWFSCPFDIPHECSLFYFFFDTTLFSSIISCSGSSRIFPDPVLKSVISHSSKEPWFLLLTKAISNKDMVSRLLLAPRVSVFLYYDNRVIPLFNYGKQSILSRKIVSFLI